MKALREGVESVCPKWRPDFEKFLTGGDYRKEFPEHLNNCSTCQSAYNHALEYLVAALMSIHIRRFLS